MMYRAYLRNAAGEIVRAAYLSTCRTPPAEFTRGLAPGIYEIVRRRQYDSEFYPLRTITIK